MNWNFRFQPAFLAQNHTPGGFIQRDLLVPFSRSGLRIMRRDPCQFHARTPLWDRTRAIAPPWNRRQDRWRPSPSVCKVGERTSNLWSRQPSRTSLTSNETPGLTDGISQIGSRSVQRPWPARSKSSRSIRASAISLSIAALRARAVSICGSLCSACALRAIARSRSAPHCR
jgi:hypothetical protein